MVSDDFVVTQTNRAICRTNKLKGLNLRYYRAGTPSVIVRKPYTMAAVTVGRYSLTWKTGIGFSKCSPKDTMSEEIGVSIAIARAVRDAVRQIEREK